MRKTRKAGGQEDLEGQEDVGRCGRRKEVHPHALPFGTLQFSRMGGLFGSHSSPLAIYMINFPICKKLFRG